MKLKGALEEKAISAIKLVKASGKIAIGLNEIKRALDTDRISILFIAGDIANKEDCDKFKLPDKKTFTKEDVQELLDKHLHFIKKQKKKKKRVDIKKELLIIKTSAEEKGIDTYEDISQKRLGKAAGAISGSASCLGVIDVGRAKNMFVEIKEENKE